LSVLFDFVTCFDFGFAHGLAVEIDTAGVVDETVEDCISEGWFTDDVAACFDGQLACDQGGTDFIAVLINFHQIAALAGVKTLRPPII
jgi:hypothetical protein